MAKRKTPKADRIIDLKPKADQITEKQLERLQALVKVINKNQNDLGVLETRKHVILHGILEYQDGLAMMQKEFQEQYGTTNINIVDGKISHDEGQDNS